jgi:hypothetical protein
MEGALCIKIRETLHKANKASKPGRRGLSGNLKDNLLMMKVWIL